MSVRLLRIAFLLYVFVGGEAALGEAFTPNSGHEHLLLGSCNLRDDPSSHLSSPPVFCLRGKVGVESVLSSGPSSEDRWGRYADGSVGVYLTSWLSLYGRARDREFRSFGQKTYPDTYRDAEYAVVNIGNPVLHKVRVSGGQMRPPFGIDRPDVDEYYRLIEDRRFWPGPTSTIALSLDDLRATELNIGFARYKKNLNLERVILKGDTHDVITARFMRDFAGNGGTRLVLSGAIDTAGARLYGVGFVNQAPNKDQLVVEMVRRLPQPDGRVLPDGQVTQIIRVGFTGHYDHDARWIFHFDDERERFRRALLEFNYILTEHLILRLGSSYRINLDDDGSTDKSRWSMISGFEGRL